MRYLLDTNIISDLIRAPQGRIAGKIAEVGEARVRTSIVVAAELRFGASKLGSRRITDRLEAILRVMEVASFEAPADEVYGLIRADLERRGTPIGGNDLLIAAQALALGDTVVTDNGREFGRVSGLAVENWLRPGPHPARLRAPTSPAGRER